jgi:carnitine 3-dehydrogenase
MSKENKNRPAPEDVKTVGILGTGVIGGGWALHFMRQGLNVIIFDPGEKSKSVMEDMVKTTWSTMEKLGLKNGASIDNIEFAKSMEEMCKKADVIQENVPEDLELKQNTYKELDSFFNPELIILSSTSGFAMSDIQAKADYPERAVVGHPFNPPYLVPFVEVAGGEKTSVDALDWAFDFYKKFEKKPVKMKKEIPGFIANRLQEALWREALHMVDSGEATVEEIDDSIAFGPGLRWAIMGPCLTFHLAGGEGGMAHMLDHFGPALKEPWTRLEAPELTKDLRDKMVEGCKREAAGRSVSDLVKERDECLISIINALEDYRKTVS